MSDAATTSVKMPIDVISDVVCPWCFIGKKRLESALALRPDIPVEIRWRPYFLNDWIPREGISRVEYLNTKFGGVDRYQGIATRVAAAAAAEGLVYASDKMTRQANTIDCHRLIRWAQEMASDKAGAMKQKLMDLYFTQGGDLSDRETLVKAAADVGLDGDAIRARLATDEDVDAVTADAEAAKNAGVSGVPFFVLGGVLAVSGAQAPEDLADAIERASAEYAKRYAEHGEAAAARPY